MEFYKVNPEIKVSHSEAPVADDLHEANVSRPDRSKVIKLGAALGAGALLLAGCAMPQEKTETAYFNVVCDDDSSPLVTSLHQEDKPTMLDTDTVSVACIDDANDVTSIKGITKTDTADGSNVTIVYKYGDGFMQEGQPQVTTDLITGKINFYGESTVESAVVAE